MKVIRRIFSGLSHGVRDCGPDQEIVRHRQRQDFLGSSDSHHRISHCLDPHYLLRPHRRGLPCRLLDALRQVCLHSLVIVRRRLTPRLPLVVFNRYVLD